MKETTTTESNNAPSILSPALPLSLPLQNKTGSSFHPACRNATISEEDGVLTFQGITSWPSWTRLWPPGLIIRQAVAAESKVSSNVSSNGASSVFGIAIEPEMGLDGRIWFQIQ
ncbi:hypothetical protein B2J93_4522 [Marssonina coronariae]|uniref:Uncharacterized protein n=1 Tax=Diplocarpon coronariae TaxID=2795749 RepID=A0A218Z7J9_9HELO|nr:hypothetical protein B2J93_4522 [Marssonina coronariae]